MRLVLNLLIICLFIGSFQSCVSQKKFDELQKQKDASDQALAQTQEQLKTLEDEKSQLEADFNAEKEKMSSEMSSIRTDLDATKSQVAQVEEKLSMTEKELEDLKNQINGIFSAYEASGLSMEERDGKIFIMTKVPVNYNSGSYRLSSDEKDALNELASALQANPSVKILVEGHTDDDKVKAGASYADNWELGYLRAKEVVKYLIANGANPNQVAAATFGDSTPKESNDSTDGKAANRRTEVVPNPNLGSVMKKN